MIGKIKKGKGFAGLTKYILKKEEASLVCTNLAGETPQDFYRQLGATRQLNPRVQLPVSHISISFAPGERPDKEKLEQIAQATLESMGFDGNLYFAATHDDRDHFHLHVAASRINPDGKCVSDWYDFHKLEKTLRNLEQQFGLAPVPCSWEVDRSAPSTGQKRRMLQEQQEFKQQLRDKPADKSALEKIQDVIDAAIEPGISMTQLFKKLNEAGVKPKVKVTREGIIQGISYSTDNIAFPGSKLGRNTKSCTLQGLQNRGVDFDLKRDAKLLATYAASNQQQTPKTSSLISLIQNHPKNLSLSLSFSKRKHSGANQNKTTITSGQDTAQTTFAKVTSSTKRTFGKNTIAKQATKANTNNNIVKVICFKSKMHEKVITLKSVPTGTLSNLPIKSNSCEQQPAELNQKDNSQTIYKVEKNKTSERLAALLKKAKKVIVLLKHDSPVAGNTSNISVTVASINTEKKRASNASTLSSKIEIDAQQKHQVLDPISSLFDNQRNAQNEAHVNECEFNQGRSRVRSSHPENLVHQTKDKGTLPVFEPEYSKELFVESQPIANSVIQIQLAREILPIATKIIDYGLEHMLHLIAKSNKSASLKVDCQYNLLTSNKLDGSASYSVIATEERGDLIRFEEGRILLAQNLKDQDVEAWKDIEVQFKEFVESKQFSQSNQHEQSVSNFSNQITKPKIKQIEL